ncbi:MAG TPA: lysophospholipid acyltransferase family protein [Longilinea sp.]|nr:lysophospholipid acyltransferase family protein [Longilinea sp.]
MNLQQIANGPVGVGFTLFVGKHTPRFIANPLGRVIAAMVSHSRNNQAVRAVRLNQWVLSGQTLGKEALDEAVHAVYRSQSTSLYDAYHYLDRPADTIKKVGLTPVFAKIFTKALEYKQGTVFISPHTASFDLAGLSLAARGLRFQVLSFPNPNGGYQWQNQLRRDRGIEVTPFSMVALQEARQRLQAGGVVLTGLDRPLPDSNYSPLFFGHPAALPVAHIRLALRTKSPLVVVACVRQPDGNYVLTASEPITAKPNSDPHIEIIENAQTVLSYAEDIIRQVPDQWAMFYPVWPDLQDAVP